MRSFDIEEANDARIAALDGLAAEAAEAGIRNVGRLIEWWFDGTQTYNADGELLLIARSGQRPIGVGGVAECPDVAGALRVRRFYVASSWRRRGVASALASRLVEHAGGHASTITCNAQASAAAPVFWEAMGFSRVEIPGITHVLQR